MPPLNVLYVCPVFRSNLVFCLFHSHGTAVSLSLPFCFLFSFSVVKSILCGSFSEGSLISSNEYFFLSELREYKSSLNE